MFVCNPVLKHHIPCAWIRLGENPRGSAESLCARNNLNFGKRLRRSCMDLAGYFSAQSHFNVINDDGAHFARNCVTVAYTHASNVLSIYTHINSRT